MKYAFLQIFILIILVSCNGKIKETDHSFTDQISDKQINLISDDSTLKISDFFNHYDTIPNKFGYSVFNNIIDSLPIGSSDFRNLWSFKVKSIENTLAARTNRYFDSNNQLSNETYFFYIDFLSLDSTSFAATIYFDLTNDMVGTYSIERTIDNFLGINIQNDSLMVKNLLKRINNTNTNSGS